MDPQSVRPLPSEADKRITRKYGKEFSYTWEIKNFKHCHHKIGEFLASPVFTTGDNDEIEWQLHIYSSGYSDDCRDYLSLRLFLLTSDVIEKQAYIVLSLVNVDGKESVAHELLLNKIIQGQKERLFKKFARRDFVVDRNNGLLPNNKLTISCKMYFGGGLAHYPHPSRIVHQKNTSDRRLREFDHFEQLLKSESFSDVMLIVGEREFRAHKSILTARSRVFAAMFEHNMRELQENSVEIADIEPEVMQEVLRFIYAGKVSNMQAMGRELLAAADKYELEGLKVMCEEELVETLSVENVGEVLLLIDRYKTDKLRASTIEFLALHAKELVNTDKFNAVMNSLSSPLLLSIIKVFMSKM